jgi:Holliday junction resolvase-like predicted endonuclease
MQTNFLEEIVAEWLEYKGYIVKRNERVGRRAAGGHEGELDVVGFNPKTKHLVHIETSTDADSWLGGRTASRRSSPQERSTSNPFSRV